MPASPQPTSSLNHNPFDLRILINSLKLSCFSGYNRATSADLWEVEQRDRPGELRLNRMVDACNQLLPQTLALFEDFQGEHLHDASNGIYRRHFRKRFYIVARQNTRTA